MHGHDLHCIGRIFRRGVGLARLRFAQQLDFIDEFRECLARARGASLSQEFFDIGGAARIRETFVAGIVQRPQQQLVDAGVIAHRAPLREPIAEVRELGRILRRKAG